MLKRALDIVLSATGLIMASPVLVPCMFLIWWHDKHSPFYVAKRVGKNEVLFDMIKLRSMVANADKTGVDSTSARDPRITSVGHFVRRFKLDELTQLINVLKGEMSLVGPRPNVKRETDLYTAEEKVLLSIKPGITDISSIVFADENDILKDSVDPDIDYNQRIRPWKSRLGLLYVKHASFALDIQLIALTVLAIVKREAALAQVEKILLGMNSEDKLRKMAGRKVPLEAFPPPGATEIVTSRA